LPLWENRRRPNHSKGKAKFVKGSAGDIAKLGNKFDVIFHQGVSSSSPMYKEDPHLVAKAIGEWISILEYAKANKSRIVWASTSSVYNGQEPPHREDMGVLVTDFYTEARYAMERLAQLDLALVQLDAFFSVDGLCDVVRRDRAIQLADLHRIARAELQFEFGSGGRIARNRPGNRGIAGAARRGCGLR
jgi:hypothetical protein